MTQGHVDIILTTAFWYATLVLAFIAGRAWK